MERIEQDVRRELRRFGAPGGLPELLESWPEVVGAEIARNAWPARIARDGTLHVATSSSAWAFELAQLAPEVLGRLRERLREATPKSLRFAPGPLPEPASHPEQGEALRQLTPGPQEVAEAHRLAAPIGDEELRESVQRAAALSLLKSRSGRSV